MMRSMLIQLVLLNCLFLESAALSSSQKYEVVFPQVIHSVYKEQGEEDRYPSMVQYGLELMGKPLVIHLEKMENLLSDNYVETRYLEDDTPVMTPSEDHIQDCHYQGYVKDDEGSSASISTCLGLSGIILTHGRKFLIEPLNPSVSGKHAVYEAEEGPPESCGVLSEDSSEDMSLTLESLQKEDADFLNSQKYIELYMVADNSMFLAYDRNVSLIKKKIYEIVNYVNMVYKAVNIFVALTGVEIWDTKNQMIVNASIQGNLKRFAQWRQQNLLPRINNDNAQLISHIDFDGPIIGLAFTGIMCNSGYSVGVIQDYSKFSGAVGTTLAHEMGHNLGMGHDNKNCSCTEDVCIMAPVASVKFPDHFSNCSQKQLQTFLLKNHPKCLLNKPNNENVVTPPVCGNKFTELGEECDCGTLQECKNPCCNATTCKLHPNAKCAEGACCQQCKIKKAGTVCKPSSDEECDLPAKCDGKSNVCPSNRLKENGARCKNGQGYCYNGQCPTLKNQCLNIWGPGVVVSKDYCYSMNTKGTNYGYCTKSNNTYVPCKKSDVKCGVLYCYGGREYPSIRSKLINFMKCKAVLDPAGMVKNGTKCGNKLVCYNGKCLSSNKVYQTL